MEQWVAVLPPHLGWLDGFFADLPLIISCSCFFSDLGGWRNGNGFSCDEIECRFYKERLVKNEDLLGHKVQSFEASFLWLLWRRKFMLYIYEYEMRVFFSMPSFSTTRLSSLIKIAQEISCSSSGLVIFHTCYDNPLYIYI